jgi:hypothetical protein
MPDPYKTHWKLDPFFFSGVGTTVLRKPKKRTHLSHYFLVLRREKRTHVPPKNIPAPTTQYTAYIQGPDNYGTL